ncbi:unnamed protein product [Symbiodinium sp. CCMP2592]|nr:unnamed protein product [Symbiodinium sp. CCMP2592]
MPQIIVYVHDKRVSLGVVLTIYRGALLKGKDKSEAGRKLRVTKPSVHALPVLTCSRVRVVHLTESAPLRYFACSHSPIELLTPQCFLGHVGNIDFANCETKLRVAITQVTKDQLDKLQCQPELLSAPATVAADGDGAHLESADVQLHSERRIYSAVDFTNSIQGSKNLEKFLLTVPKLWSDKGVPITDESGCIVLQGGKSLQWFHICKRAPEYFDIAYSGSAKNFGRFVVGQMSQVLPEGDFAAAKSRLYRLVGKIDGDFKKGIALLRMSNIAYRKPAPAKSRCGVPAGNDRDAGEAATDRLADDDRHADEGGNDRDADEVGTDQDACKQTKQTESPPVRGERVIVCL